MFKTPKVKRELNAVDYKVMKLQRFFRGQEVAMSCLTKNGYDG